MILHRLALAATMAALPALAQAHMLIEDAYARAARPDAPTGAAFMAITNHSALGDVLVGVSSDAAERAELHTHEEDANGVMRMIHVEDGFPIDSGDTLVLERGGHHVMLMGLTRPFDDGDEIEITLEFMFAAPVTVTVPIDSQRQPDGHGGHGGHGDHSGHGGDG